MRFLKPSAIGATPKAIVAFPYTYSHQCDPPTSVDATPTTFDATAKTHILRNHPCQKGQKHLSLIEKFAYNANFSI